MLYCMMLSCDTLQLQGSSSGYGHLDEVGVFEWRCAVLQPGVSESRGMSLVETAPHQMQCALVETL